MPDSIDLLDEALHDSGIGCIWDQRRMSCGPLDDRMSRPHHVSQANALRERGVHLVTAESLARAAQNHETSGIHGSLHCSLACGASLFAALEEASE